MNGETVSITWPQRSHADIVLGIGTHTTVIRPHTILSPADLEVRRITRRLTRLTETLDGTAPDFDQRAEIAATTLLMSGKELDLVGIAP
jgi:hypothetical protein